MENISIEGTAKTPTVQFNYGEASLSIVGRSIPENSIEFYKPLIDWIDDYSKAPKEKTEINIQLEYFNTSSSKCILDVFKKLEGIQSQGFDISVNWYYEEDDEDMLEAGEDYDAIINLPFKMLETKEG